MHDDSHTVGVGAPGVEKTSAPKPGPNENGRPKTPFRLGAGPAPAPAPAGSAKPSDILSGPSILAASDLSEYARCLASMATKHPSEVLPELEGVEIPDPLAARVIAAARRLWREGRPVDLIAIHDADPELDRVALGHLWDNGLAQLPYFVARLRQAQDRAFLERLPAMVKDALDPLALAASILAKRTAPRVDPGGFTFEPVDVENVRPPEWIVRGLIERATVGAVYGPPSSGKSFFAVGLAASIATGRSFHGFEVRSPGPVLYMAAEGHGGLGRRFRAWARDSGTDLSAAPLLLSRGRFSLVDPEAVVEIERAVAAAVEARGAPSLVVVDTWARAMAGADENLAGDVGRALAALEDIRDRYGCAVLIVHHSGAAGSDRARGSTAFRAALDFELSATRAPSGEMMVQATKTKDGTPPPPLAFLLDDVDLGLRDEEGEPVRSAVLRRTDPPVDSKSDRAADAEVLRALEAAGPLGVPAPRLAEQLGRGAGPVRGSLSRLKASHLAEKVGGSWRAIPPAPGPLRAPALKSGERWSADRGAAERSGAVGAVGALGVDE